MDHKPSRPKATNIISFLPTRTSFTVRYHPHSPGAAEASAAKMKNVHSRGFSGPLVSIVPMEARRKEIAGSNAETQEPTSPKVSCIGQINHKKKAAGRGKNPPTAVTKKHEKKETKKKLSSSSTAEKQKKRPSAFSIVRNIFGRKARSAPDAGSPDIARGRDPVKQKFPEAPVMAPSLGQMKRFASGRGTLGSFDWKKVDMMREKAAVAEEEEESGRDRFNWFSDEEEEDDVIIPHSAPIMIGGGGVVALEPKKEVSIWKRRMHL